MKIVFLDIDGVLNSISWFEAKRKQQNKTGNKYDEIDPEKVKLLKEIVDRTGAEIVLSSSWRDLCERITQVHTTQIHLTQVHPMYTYLTDTLKEFNLEIKDHTPYIDDNRPEEIKAWIDNQGDKNIRFVSLDDDFSESDYEKYGIADCLVKTSFYDPDGGLRQEHVEKAVKLLNT